MVVGVNHVVLCWAGWLWITMCYAEPVVVNPSVLCWASGCEPCWVMLRQWLWIMVCYAEWVGVNHGVLCWASGCESCRVMLSQWLSLWIMLYYAEPGCFESQCAMPSQWLQIIANYAEQVNHVVLCWVGGCESSCFLCWASGCESWCAMLSQ